MNSPLDFPQTVSYNTFRDSLLFALSHLGRTYEHNFRSREETPAIALETRAGSVVVQRNITAQHPAFGKGVDKRPSVTSPSENGRLLCSGDSCRYISPCQMAKATWERWTYKRRCSRRSKTYSLRSSVRW